MKYQAELTHWLFGKAEQGRSRSVHVITNRFGERIVSTTEAAGNRSFLMRGGFLAEWFDGDDPDLLPKARAKLDEMGAPRDPAVDAAIAADKGSA